jgi:hypothetical protein
MTVVQIKGINKVRRRLSDGGFNLHFYHRKTGRKLRGEPGSAEFAASYAEAERAQGRAAKLLQDVIDRYRQSASFGRRPVANTSGCCGP